MGDLGKSEAFVKLPAPFVLGSDVGYQYLAASFPAVVDKLFHQGSADAFSGMFRMEVDGDFPSVAIGSLTLPGMCIAVSGDAFSGVVDQEGKAGDNLVDEAVNLGRGDGKEVEGSGAFLYIMVVDGGQCIAVCQGNGSYHSDGILMYNGNKGSKKYFIVCRKGKAGF